MIGRQTEGTVIGYVPGQRTGRIKGVDGVQYTFDLADVDDTRLASRIQSQKGTNLREPVEFVSDGYRARAIKPSESAGSASARKSPFSLRLPENLTQHQAFGQVSVPTRGTGVYHEAKAAVERGQPELAVPLFQEAIRQEDNTFSAVKDLASAYLMLEQSADAIKLLKGFAASPDLPGDELSKFRNLLENAQAKAVKERKNRKKSYLELKRSTLADGIHAEPSRLAAQLSKHLAALPPVTSYLSQDEDEDEIDDLSGRHFLGTIKSLPTAGAPGRILAHYELSRNVSTGSWRLDDGDGFKDLGPSSLAEWAPEDGSSEVPVGTLVHFVVGDRTSDYGIISDTAPWYTVRLQVERLGALIISTPENFWTESERHVPYRDSKLTFYCAANGTLTGPWQVKPDTDGGVLVPLSPDGTVKEILIEDLEPDMIVEIEGQEYLLPCSTVPVARMVDVRASQELTEWLISTLSSLSSEVIERMDESHPRWRSDLENSVNTLSDPQERATFLARWQRVEPIVEALSYQNEIFQRLLNENPTLSGLLKTNLRHALDQARSDIFRQAEAEAAELLEAERAELARLQEEVRQIEARAHSLKDNPASTTIRMTSETGNANVSVSTGFHQVLAAKMLTRIPEIAANDAATFHLASLTCRCLIVPSCAWSKSYFETFSPDSADFTNLAASPTWLTFEDVWRGGFSTPWQHALGNPDRVYLVHFTHFNHSMFDCWAPALLLSSADLATQLPGLSTAAWPSNLRTFWSPAPSPGLFPSSMDLVGAFAAVIPASDGLSSTTTFDKPESPRIDEVSGPHWLSCVPAVQNAKGGPAPTTRVLREFARRATDDIGRLVQAGNSLSLPMDVDQATRIRIQWPREVLSKLGSRADD